MNPLFLLVMFFLIAACISGLVGFVLAALIYFRVFPRNIPHGLRFAAGACCIVLSPIASFALTFPLLGVWGFLVGPFLVVLFVIGQRNRRASVKIAAK
jgi:hypothetical protein